MAGLAGCLLTHRGRRACYMDLSIRACRYLRGEISGVCVSTSALCAVGWLRLWWLLLYLRE
jgi:hypothetical protein